MALIGLVAGLLVPLSLPASPVGAEELPGTLNLVSGELVIRDAEEPADLALPTKLDLTVDDANGLITAGQFSAAPLSFSFDIIDPLPATVFVDAEFTQITPGAVSAGSNVTKVSDTEADVTVGVEVRVDLHVEVQPPGGGTSFLVADCTATPVSLRLTSITPYDYDTGQVTLGDADFSVPPVTTRDPAPPDPGCVSIIADGVNERLAGGGHSITMNTEGEIPFIKVGVCKTATTLAVDPASSRQGDEVTFSAAVSKVNAEPCNPAPAEPVTGVVEFLDGATVLGSAPVDGNGEASIATTALAVGNRSLTARYNGDEVFETSTSDATDHLVAAAPTVTLPDPINSIVIEGNPRPVTVGLTNPAQFGATIDDARLDLTIARVASNTSVLTPDRMTLEYFDGSSWTPVTLTEGPPRSLTGSITGVDLAPGENLEARFRYRAFAVVPGDPPPTGCQAPQPTCPGPLTITAKLVSGDAARTFASDQRPVNLIESSRRPTTAAFAGGVVRPHTVRQGFSLLAATTLTPNFGAVPWGGLAEAYIDGVQVQLRDVTLGFDEGLADQYEVHTPTMTPWILLPDDIEPGPHLLTMRYLGDAFHGPAEVTGVFTVIERLPEAHPFVCREKTFSAQVEWGASIIFETNGLPATALAGTEIPFTADDARLLMHRRTASNLMIFAPNNATTNLGTNNLDAITFNLGDQGAASATGVTRTGDALLPNIPYPAPESDVDQTLELHGVAGSLTVTGEPGDVVPIELTEFVIDYRDPAFHFPLGVRCTARGRPMELGEVEVAGTTVSASPDPAREGTDVMEIEAEVFPSGAAGTVTFSSDLDGTLGSDTVTEGVASWSAGNLRPGTHTITASFDATDPAVPDSVGTTTVRVTYSPRRATERFVIAARTDYTGSADKADVLADAAALEGGKTRTAYLSQLSRSDAYLAHVVNEMYLDTLAREGDEAGVAFWTERLRNGWSVARVMSHFYGSVEHFNRSGGTAEAWIDDLYDKLLGRPADTAGQGYWVGQVAQTNRESVALRFFQTPESARARVTVLYQRFLGRTPDAAGRDYWAGRVISQGDLVLAVHLTLSNEYATRATTRFPLV